MPTRKAEATWNGDLKKGSGHMAFGSGAFEGAYSFKSRFEEGTGTNPEELIGAAHAGCFSMALSAELAKAGLNPESVNTEAKVNLDAEKGAITTIELNVKGNIPDTDEETFRKHAENAKENCPVSKALKGVDIKLNAELSS
ncbi:MAG TPA: OsmC family protein [Balneolaceae bacterium]